MTPSKNSPAVAQRPKRPDRALIDHRGAELGKARVRGDLGDDSAAGAGRGAGSSGAIVAGGG